MKLRYLLLLFLVAGSILAAFRPAIPGVTKRVGVYSSDTLMAAMPEHQRELDSVAAYRAALNKQLQKLKADSAQKQEEFNRDSASWSGAVKKSKRRDLDQSTGNVFVFRVMIDYNVRTYRLKFIAQISDQILAAAARLASSKGFSNVISSEILTEYLLAYPDARVTNVTAEMIKEVAKK